MNGPRISVVVPAHDMRSDHLTACLDSILAQTFTDWEMVAIDDASPGPQCRETLERYAKRDERVKVIRRPVDGGIAAASNAAIAAAAGEFVALVDHDDVLKPGALASVAEELDLHDDIDYLYTDEEYLHDDGSTFAVRKPDWSPERLRSVMYTGHLSVIRTSLVREVGGFREGFDGSQDHDLVLRATERARRIVHVPRIVCTRRIHDDPVSRSESTGRDAHDAGRRAVQDHCDRTGIGAIVEDAGALGVYRVRRVVTGDPLVSVVIPTRGTAAYLDGQYAVLVDNCITTILDESTWKNFEFVVVADSDTPPAVLDRLGARCGERLRVIPYDREFNFADKCNRGVVESAGDVIVLLNDDTRIIDADWCETMLGLVQESRVGMVGCLLYVNDLSVQHAGLIFHGHAPHNAEVGMPFGAEGHGRGLVVQREVGGLTGAAVMIRRDVYMEVGGMSTRFPNNYNDVDLGFKIRHAGYSAIFTPFARMFHFESLTRDKTVVEEELELLRRRWWRELASDPYDRTQSQRP